MAIRLAPHWLVSREGDIEYLSVSALEFKINFTSCDGAYFSPLFFRGWFGRPLVFVIRGAAPVAFFPVFDMRTSSIRLSIFCRLVGYFNSLEAVCHFFDGWNRHLATIGRLRKSLFPSHSQDLPWQWKAFRDRVSGLVSFSLSSSDSKWLLHPPEACQFQTYLNYKRREFLMNTIILRRLSTSVTITGFIAS